MMETEDKSATDGIASLNRNRIGHEISEIPSPAFLVDKNKVVNNCQKMLTISRGLKLKLRPMTKTHKTIEGALLQTGGSKECITVSTLQEAEFYADNGFDDILLALPLAAFHFPRIWTLTNRLQKFHVLLDNLEVAQSLVKFKPPQGKRWSAFLKVDTGNNRAGVWWMDNDKAKAICVLLAKEANFQGLYVHCGNAYHVNSAAEVVSVRQTSVQRLFKLAKEINRAGVTISSLAVGSTPTLSQKVSLEAQQQLQKLTEAHPGNYIFYDLQQASLGACTLDEISCRVMTRVIGHYPNRKQIIIDCGFTALTKQGLDANKIVPGYAVFEFHPDIKLVEMTQEIGKVEAVDGQLNLDRYPIGTIFFLFPYHACATAAMHGVYYVHKDYKIIEEWRPTRGW